MGSFADYAEDKVLELIVGKTAFATPTAYIGLKTGDPLDDNSGGTEPTDPTGAYERITTAGANWATSSGGSIDNSAILAFAESTAAWSTGATPLTHFIMMDAITGGNCLAHGSLSVARTVNAAGVTLAFAIGDLTITLD